MRVAQVLTGGLCLAIALGCQESGGNGGTPAEDPTTQTGSITVTAPLVQVATLEGETVDAGCAMCIYELPGAEQCLPAIVIDGRPVLVTGIEIDLHEHDMCTESRSVVVTGEIRDGSFVAKQFDI
ncbi:MAG: DUF6370 family protein [Planctomycetota bacterium]|jgi:hypothetical protein